MHFLACPRSKSIRGISVGSISNRRRSESPCSVGVGRYSSKQKFCHFEELAAPESVKMTNGIFIFWSRCIYVYIHKYKYMGNINAHSYFYLHISPGKCFVLNWSKHTICIFTKNLLSNVIFDITKSNILNSCRCHGNYFPLDHIASMFLPKMCEHVKIYHDDKCSKVMVIFFLIHIILQYLRLESHESYVMAWYITWSFSSFSQIL